MRFVRACPEHLAVLSDVLRCPRCCHSLTAWLVLDTMTGCIVAADRSVKYASDDYPAVWLRAGFKLPAFLDERRLGVPRPPHPQAA